MRQFCQKKYTTLFLQAIIQRQGAEGKIIAVKKHSVTQILSQPTQVLDILEEQNTLVSGLSGNFGKQDKYSLAKIAKNEQQLQAMKEQNEAKRLELMFMLLKQQKEQD